MTRTRKNPNKPLRLVLVSLAAAGAAFVTMYLGIVPKNNQEWMTIYRMTAGVALLSFGLTGIEVQLARLRSERKDRQRQSNWDAIDLNKKTIA